MNLNTLESLLSHIDSIVLLGGAMLWAISRFLKQKEKRKSGIEYNSNIDKQIYKLIWPLLVRLRATRVFIFQFHNGNNFYTGQSIQRKTMSHECVADESRIPSIKKNFDNVLVSEMMHDIIGILKDDQVFGIDSLDEQNDKLAPRIFAILARQAGVYEFKSMYYFRIVNNKSQTVAILGFHFRHAHPVNDHEKGYILEYKKQIESVFNTL